MTSLFWKIFLWFWAAMVLVNLASVAITYRPVDQDRAFVQMARFMGRSLVLEGRNAATVLELQGPSELKSFLQGLGPFWKRYLLDEEGESLSGAELSDELVVQVSNLLEGPPRERLVQRPFYIQPVTSRSGQDYLFVAEMRTPSRGRQSSGRFWLRLMPMFGNLTATKLMAMLGASAIVCLALARYLAAPIVKLRAATRELSGGNLQVRVGSEMGRRRDESALLARDFDRMAEQIESLLEAQGRLMSDISHELRSPLARLQVALELARQSAGEGAAASLDRIELEAGRLNDLIGRLLILTRLESGDVRLNSEEVDLEELLRGVVLDADFEARSTDRSVRLLESGECTVHGCGELLRSALENIIRNAVRFSQAGAQVDVSLRRKATGDLPMAVIEVRDHGPGVQPERLEKIFEPFHSTPAGGNPEFASTGLGLPIARRSVELHGGSIQASNHPGGGLSVRVEIPVRKGS